jgi:branched-chain amino acid transport system substrate-binding protein
MFRLVTAFAIFLALLVLPATAAKRVALVIGNSKYIHVPVLNTPPRDVSLVAQALRNVGFDDVRVASNLGNDAMRRALREFSDSAADAEVALVYFAGHGIEVNRVNYLAPVDAQLKKSKDAEFEAVALEQFRTAVAGATKLRMVVLDACRNNPFPLEAKDGTRATRSIGLVEVQTGVNELIAFSAQQGVVADDGPADGNSPFAAALSKWMMKPGLDIRFVMGHVRDEVLANTGPTDNRDGPQIPYVESSLGGDQIVFNAAPLPVPAPAGTDIDRNAEAKLVFDAAGDDINMLRTVASEFAETTWGKLAAGRVKTLESQLALLPPKKDDGLAQIQPTGDIVIGVAGPITGPMAALGEQLKKGAQQAIADINKSGGVLGRKLKLQLADDACDPTQAMDVATKFVAEKVSFVVGHMCSNASVNASQIYAENDVLQISPATTQPKFTDSGLWNVHRLIVREDEQGPFAARFVARRYRDKNIAVVDDKTPYGSFLAASFVRELSRQGVSPNLVTSADPLQTDDGPLARNIKVANIDVLYFGGNHGVAARLIKQVRKAGSKAQMLSGDDLNTAEFWEIAGKAGEGVLYTYSADPRKIPAARKVVGQFRAAGFEPESYTLITYAAVQVIQQSLESIGEVNSRKAASWLRAGNPVDTVLGNIQLDKKGDIVGGGFVWYKFSKGNFAADPSIK